MFLIYIIILLHLFQLISCQTVYFEPSQRFAHTATLIDNKLYMFGGYDVFNPEFLSLDDNEFFYLDFSTSFNTQELTWEDLSTVYTLPSHASSAAVKGGTRNNTLFLYG